MNTLRRVLCAIGVAGLTGLPVHAAPVETKGFLKYEVWFPSLRDPSLTGTTVSIFTSDSNYPNTPDLTSYTAGWNSRTVFPDDTHEQYGSRITGWITPTVTGDYNFYLASDDNSELWISTDATAANLVLVAQESNYDGGFSEIGNPQTTSTPIHLVAGQKYWIQSLQQEGTGGDFVQVAWQAATGTTPAAALRPLTGMMVSSTAESTGASVTITQQPQAVTKQENQPVTFSIAATAVTPFNQYTAGGTPAQGSPAPLGTAAPIAAFYQWFTNGVAVGGANGTDFSIAWPKKAADANKLVKCYVAVPGASVYSSEVKLTVADDTTPPTITKAGTDLTFTSVTLTFSEPVTDSALAISNFKFDQGVTVSAATRVDDLTVRLTTSKMAEGSSYTLTVNGVQDTATPANTIAANSTVQVRSFVFLTGTILHKKYDNCSDSYTLANFLSDPRFPNTPDRQDLESMWEYPPNAVGRVAADPVRNYCDTLEGFFIPPTSGNYVFLTCGDDEFYLYLSTDADPANKYQICSEPGGWTDNRSWMTLHSGDLTAMRSDQYATTQWPNANTITLTAGQRYYMLSMHHDHSWSGGDYHGVTYKLESDPDPNNGDAPKLTGNVVGYYFDPTGASVDFTQQPQSVTNIIGTSVTLSAAATGTSAYGTTVFYQWQSAPKGSSTWANIANATTAAYATPLLAAADNGTQFRVIATAPPVSATSIVASVTVVSDTTPPVVSVGAMPDPTTVGTVDIGVGFNKTVDTASGSLLANYSVSSGTITGLTWYTNRFTDNSQNPLAKIVKQTALLKVTGLSGGGTLTVKNISDTLGNKLTSTNVSFTVDSKMTWGVVGANQSGGWNAVVPVAAHGFDVYSDGVGEWGTYDETTFVYEQITGDFDKKVRVEYQDNSSEWARAGLIVRDVLNLGMDSATQATEAGRYQKCHVNPVGATLTGPGTAGNASWEGNRRLDTGSATTSAGGGGTPLYPNAWCRIKREGQKFSIYRSDDGVTWTLNGSTTWGVDDASKTPMPDTVFVGPEFSPENGNVTQAADQGTFLAQFRDYSDVVADPQLKVARDATGKLTISWAAGTLVSSPTVNGTYTPVTGATSPYGFTPASGTTTFYQVKL